MNEKLKKIHNIITIIFLSLLLLGIIVCAICDYAITGGFTWSLYPTSAAIYAGLALVPIIKYGVKGILPTLISVSVFTIPFIYLMSILVGESLIFSMGVKIALSSLVYIWLVYINFIGLKSRKFIAGAFSLLLAIPLCFVINFIISKYYPEPLLDVWDILTIGIITVGAVILVLIDVTQNKKNK